MSHNCLAPNCSTVCYSRHLFCHAHWLALPFRLQKKLLAVIDLPECGDRAETVSEAIKCLEQSEGVCV